MITMSGIAKGFDKQYELDIIGTDHIVDQELLLVSKKNLKFSKCLNKLKDN